MSQTELMGIGTVTRTWTIATWLLAGCRDQIEEIDRAIEDLGADAVLLQSIRRSDVTQLAAGLGFNHVWALSHYPRSRLIRGSAVGLAVLSPHRVGESFDVVVGAHRSTWSTQRRIAQTAAVVRSDHSSYEFAHAVAPASVLISSSSGAPTVRVHPARIDSDPNQAIELPESASVVSLSAGRPIPGAAQLLSMEFEMPWVQGDFTAAS